MKHSLAPAVTTKVRLSARLGRLARLLTAGVMAGLAFLAAQRPAGEPTLPGRSIASNQAMAEAWALSQRAQILAEQRRPAAALVSYQRAYALSTDPTLLLEVARLEEQVGSPARAAHALEVFLERGAERLPQQRQLALRQLKELSAHTARVNLQTNVQGAEAELEAERGVAKSSGFVVSLLLDVGERRIHLSKPGYETQTVSLNLEPGEVRSLRVDLDKAARGRTYTVPAKPRWVIFAPPAESKGGGRFVEDVRATL